MNIARPLRDAAKLIMRRSMLSGAANRVIDERLTYLSIMKFLSLQRLVREAKRRGVPGDFIEFGVALGGSAIFLASELDDGRRFDGYDVFGMIPAPGERDGPDVQARYTVIAAGEADGIGGDVYYGYRDDLYDRVVASFARHGAPVDQRRIALHRGLFEDTVGFDPDKVIAVAHVDCDWYDPVLLCLRRSADHVAPRGVVVLDDYHAYSGCREATHDFLRERPDFALESTRHHAILRRRAAG